MFRLANVGTRVAHSDHRRSLIAAIGVLWPWLGRLGLGRLPGDIVIERENITLYGPIGTGLLISLVPSFIFWQFSR